MCILAFELRRAGRTALVWALGLGLFLLIFLPVFASMLAGETAGVTAQFEGNQFILAMGYDPEIFTSPEGMCAFLTGFVMIAAAVQALNLGLLLLGGEFSGRTAEFLLVKPWSRSAIWGGKALAGLAVLLGTGVSYAAAALAAMALVAPGGRFSIKGILLLCLSLTLVQILFWALGLLLGAVLPRLRSTLPMAVGIAFLSYCMGMFSNVVDSMPARLLSPYRYFPGTRIVADMALNPGYTLLWAGLTAALALGSLLAFSRRDAA